MRKTDLYDNLEEYKKRKAQIKQMNKPKSLFATMI